MFNSTNIPFDQCSFDESALDESVFDESTPTLYTLYPPKKNCLLLQYFYVTRTIEISSVLRKLIFNDKRVDPIWKPSAEKKLASNVASFNSN